MADFTTRLTKAASGFMYAFSGREQDSGQELFRFEASRLQHTRGGVLADVTIYSHIDTARVIPGSKSRYVTRQVIDLLSARSKADFGSLLNGYIPAPKGAAPIDWAVTVEEFAMAVMDAENERPAVLDLSLITPSYDLPYLVPYVLPVGKPTILYGAGGTGKSILASAMAAAVQTGSRFLGWPTEQANVLYLDWETDEADLSRRNALASAGLGLKAPAPVRYMRPGAPLNDHDTLSHIAVAVAEMEIGLVVVDSTVMAMKSSAQQQDPAEAAKDFFNAIRTLGVTALAIDHLAGDDMKARKNQSTKPYGSVFKWNIARNVFELVAPDDEPDTLILNHRKSNIGPRMERKTMTMTWDSAENGGVKFSDSPKAFKYEMPIGTRILTVLDAAGPTHMRDMERLLELQDGYDAVNPVEIATSIKDLESQELVYLDKVKNTVYLKVNVLAGE